MAIVANSHRVLLVLKPDPIITSIQLLMLPTLLLNYKRKVSSYLCDYNSSV
jgi:hypothetical protein